MSVDEGNAEAIVTGDKAMLAIGEYEGTRLVTLADGWPPAHRQLVLLPGGGLLLDTPGMRELQLVADDGLETVFGDIAALAGTLGAAAIRLLVPKLPVEVPPWTVVLAFTFSVFVGIFFGAYPARKAAALHPIEALRYE